jgi:signal transduction histidine kinase
MVQQGERYGTLRLRATTAPLTARIHAYLLGVVLAALGVLVISLALAAQLQRLISRPILNLAGVARKIADKSDYSVRATKMSDDEVGYLASTFNVMLSEIERRQTEAADAIGLRDDFMSIASHELRTPLTSLRLTMERIKRLTPGDPLVFAERIRNLLSVMERQVGRLEVLAGKLLDVTRIREGALLLEVEEIDLSATVKDVLDGFADELARVNCPIELCAPGPVMGRWDRARIDQVIANIISNSIKYAPGKPISVSVMQVGEIARVVVSDRGIGVPDEAKQRIFGPYERAVSAAEYGSLGLGLYISHQIVRAHGGTLSVSDTPGGGATFTIELPR